MASEERRKDEETKNRNAGVADDSQRDDGPTSAHVPNVIKIEERQELIPDSSPTIRADVAPRQHVRIRPKPLIRSEPTIEKDSKIRPPRGKFEGRLIRRAILGLVATIEIPFTTLNFIGQTSGGA